MQGRPLGSEAIKLHQKVGRSAAETKTTLSCLAGLNSSLSGPWCPVVEEQWTATEFKSLLSLLFATIK